jgi:hypothetical protein
MSSAAGSRSFAGESPLARGFAARASAVAFADSVRERQDDKATLACAWALIGIEAQLSRIANALDRDGRDALS